MEFSYCLSQVFLVEMGVNFGGGNGLVSEHLLHCTQVGAVAHKLGGEGVAETVRTYGLVYPRFLHRCLYKHKYVLPREFLATPRQKNIVLVAGFYFYFVALAGDVKS